MPAHRLSLVPNNLRKIGITLVDRAQALQDNVILRCNPPGYWKCPKDCNQPVI